MSKTYRTPVVASLGNADVLTEVKGARGTITELSGSFTTTHNMLDL